VFGLATILGPLAGGFFVDNLSWHWIFFINIPLALIALGVIAVAFTARIEKHNRRIDYLGAALLAIALTAIVLFTSLGGNTLEWNSPGIIAMIVVGFLGTLAFLWAETRAAEPIVPLSLFRNSVFSMTSAIGFIVGLALFGAVTFLPLYLQVVQGVSVNSLHIVFLVAAVIGVVAFALALFVEEKPLRSAPERSADNAEPAAAHI
jgi:MFS family permease